MFFSELIQRFSNFLLQKWINTWCYVNLRVELAIADTPVRMHFSCGTRCIFSEWTFKGPSDVYISSRGPKWF